MLINTRNHFVGDQFTIFIPVSSIFLGQSVIISECAVNNQNSQKDDIEIRNWTGKKSWQTPK